jgi:hypothetical protein
MTKVMVELTPDDEHTLRYWASVGRTLSAVEKFLDTAPPVAGDELIFTCDELRRLHPSIENLHLAYRNALMAVTQEWISDWPTVPGNYWFYGSRFGHDDPEIHFVKAWRASNKVIVYVADGAFMYKEEGAEGKWTKAVLPKLPAGR